MRGRGERPWAQLGVASEVVIEEAGYDAQVGAQTAGEADGLQLRLVPTEVVLQLFRVDAKTIGQPRRQLR
jgi:hypothetical protein